MTTSDSDRPALPQVVTPALLRAARSAYIDAIRKALADAGFEDLPKNGPFVLGAMVNFGFPSAEVVRQLGVTKQAASQLIDVLVVRGYLERVPDPDDRRRVTLKPTERGRAAAVASRAGVETVDRELARRHPPAELVTFRACLATLAEVGAHDEGAGHPEGEASPPSTTGPPRTRFVGFSPIFAVRDLQRALEHYRTLGFTVKAYAGGDEYGFADRDGVGLHLAAEKDFDPARDASEAYLHVADADALWAEWSAPGIDGKTRPVGTMEYGMREGSHSDPDNNLIRFGSGRSRPPTGPRP
ncbi:MAG: MarR family transcriptional regulator [Nitrososphaerales archaeon]